MRDGLAAVDRVQLHINNGKKGLHPQRPGLDQALFRGSVGRFLSGPGESASGTFETCRPAVTVSASGGIVLQNSVEANRGP
jgi:hypothetical protein